MHKCSAYCKRRRRCGSTFITRCRFGFPRQACQSATLHCVEEALKSRKRIYELPRSNVEVRVNDYNPLLLMLWKANIDIQYVAESSLALAHYVSGYFTKRNKATCRTSGRKLVIVRVYTVDSGALASAVYALESVDCMKLVISYLVTTSPKSPRLSSG